MPARPEWTFFLFLLLVTGTSLTGCGSHSEKPVASATPTPLPVKVKGYVRLDNLIALSPLQDDVSRLGRAEQRLLRLARPDATAAEVAALSGGGDLLPALAGAISRTAVAGAEGARSAREERLVSATERLRQTVTHSLEAYDMERTHRQTRLISRERAELETEGAEHEAEDERKARDAAYAKAIAESAVTAKKVPEVTAPLAVISAQLGHRDPVTKIFEPGTLPPIENDDKFKADVATVAAGKDGPGISMQARLEARRHAKFEALNALQAELARIQALATQRADLAASEVARRRLDEIESKLDALSDDADLRFQLRDQRNQLDAVIADQIAAAERTETRRRQVVGTKDGVTDAAGAMRLGDLFGVSSSHQDRAGATNAADRVAHQRQRLQQFIVADVKTAVMDAARARNIDVILVSKPLSGATGSIAGRKDMTNDFVIWTTPGTGGVIPIKPVQPGWPIKGGGAESRPGG